MRKPYDEFAPDLKVCEELGVTAMTLWRWDHDPAKAALGWPPPIRIGPRKFRSRKLLEEFKAAMVQRALADRASRSAKSHTVPAEAGGA